MARFRKENYDRPHIRRVHKNDVNLSCFKLGPQFFFWKILWKFSQNFTKFCKILQNFTKFCGIWTPSRLLVQDMKSHNPVKTSNTHRVLKFGRGKEFQVYRELSHLFHPLILVPKAFISFGPETSVSDIKFWKLKHIFFERSECIPQIAHFFLICLATMENIPPLIWDDKWKFFRREGYSFRVLENGHTN